MFGQFCLCSFTAQKNRPQLGVKITKCQIQDKSRTKLNSGLVSRTKD